MNKNVKIEVKKGLTPSNLAKNPLKGYEMKYILEKSGTRGSEFAGFCGRKYRTWTRAQYIREEVALRVAEALREFIGVDSFEYFLNKYRTDREERIKEIAGLRNKDAKSKI